MEFKKDFFLIKGDILTLALLEAVNGNEKELPFYWYEIILNKTNTSVGKISLRIGHNYHSYFNGNIGYEIDKPCRGNHYSYIACQMLKPLAKAHDMKKIYLACNYDNIASYKTIEKLGATLVEVVTPPSDYIYYYDNIKPQRIYELNI